jgi:hypothetical protein
VSKHHTTQPLLEVFHEYLSKGYLFSTPRREKRKIADGYKNTGALHSHLYYAVKIGRNQAHGSMAKKYHSLPSGRPRGSCDQFAPAAKDGGKFPADAQVVT